MKIELWFIGKTSFSYLKEGLAIYENRLKRYGSFNSVLIPDVKHAKNMNAHVLKIKEGEAVLNRLKPNDTLIVLDENGKAFTSVELAKFIEEKQNYSTKTLVFLIGGAFGFSEAVYQRAQHKLSLSKMTFSHQMIRLFVVEQLYRAFTIINSEPYHNEG